MPRPATGQVLERRNKSRVFALRFRAYGHRHYLTLGSAEEGWTLKRAEQELQNVLADVRRGIWQPPEAEPVHEPEREPTFGEYASGWLANMRSERLAERTIEDYEWALNYHLLPFFENHLISRITRAEVDRYRRAKVEAGVLCANSINKTLTRLAQILEYAVEDELLPANPASGKRRRLKGERPRRTVVEPEQLPALLEAARYHYGKRGRPLLAVLAGGGLRIDEALSLRRRCINLARGTLTVEAAKTDTGVRIVDLSPALRDELALYLADSPWQQPDDLVFPTSTGRKDNRNNVRRRLVLKAAEDANAKLGEVGIAPIGQLAPHGLRHTYASLRCALNDPMPYTAAQLGIPTGASR